MPKRLIRPSLIIAAAPAPPSSAGWKITTAVPAKLRVSARYFGSAEQHRGVAVMAAGMHLAGHRRFIRQAGFLLDRQGIHVGAQAEHLVAGLPAADDADHAGAADAGNHLVAAEAFELVGDRGRGAVHVVTQLRMGMKVPPPFLDLAVQIGDAVDYRHGNVLVVRLARAVKPNLAKRPGKSAQSAYRGW